jgi:hypothetical protein
MMVTREEFNGGVRFETEEGHGAALLDHRNMITLPAYACTLDEAKGLALSLAVAIGEAERREREHV